jgi:hypothetical protein
MIAASEPWAMTADQAARRSGYADRAELRLRNAMEAFLRARFPEARMCHEMVMGEGKVRADLVAVGTDHIAAVEVKGDYDNTTRLLHQVGMYQLCVPEVWIVTAKGSHAVDAGYVKWLMPSVGLITGTGFHPDAWGRGVEEECVLTVAAEPVPRSPVPELMLRMLWAQELANIAIRTRLLMFAPSKIPVRKKCVDVLLEKLIPSELMAECCTELRARQALWRADPAVSEKGGMA